MKNVCLALELKCSELDRSVKNQKGSKIKADFAEAIKLCLFKYESHRCARLYRPF